MNAIHDPLYSYALLLSLVCAGVAAAWDGARLVPALLRKEEASERLGASRVPRVLTAVAIAALGVSLAVHARWGHGADSPEPMAFSQLLGAHPAFLWGAMLIVAAGVPGGVLAARARERRNRTD